jgi:hypothetical protein
MLLNQPTVKQHFLAKAKWKKKGTKSTAEKQNYAFQ